MKGISIAVLALIAAALFLSFSAFAESAGSDAPAIAVTADGQQKYSLSLASAVADAGDGGSVKLLQDVEIDSVSGLAITCSITLDLNGKTIGRTLKPEKSHLRIQKQHPYDNGQQSGADGQSG